METNKIDEIVTCKACGRRIDFNLLADCHPYGTPGCAFEERGGNGKINMPHREMLPPVGRK